MYKRRRALGAYLGAVLATVLLPGIRPIDDNVAWAALLPGLVFLIVNQLISSYPSSIRTAPPVMLLILGAIGIVQDTLIWLLVSWISAQMDSGLDVDGFLAALLGGVVVRLTVLTLMAIGPQPTPEAEAA
ncbi:phage holin family protein [Streptomyces sp. Act143]|uniref:phage holin family protein n=1 Tax=Streptomyces sp. Act143 TaxID=2200760 RepID=UPI0015E80C4A|nr:phage holin family protein [Streptomyces sp. Act143]